METASFLDPPNSPPNVSFALRGPRTNNFLRSVSTKESPFTEAPCSPPHLSTATSLSINLHSHSHSQPSTPHLSFTPSNKLDDLHTTYSCICSVLKKDGQILSVATSGGLVYTGSQGNTIRIWKMPEFTECGQLKTKACMAVALEVSNDRIYAAYSDCKIRVWRRTWEGVIKHIRLATIPNTGSYVRSYIAGKDKMTRHFGPISSLAINISDDILYSASLDKTVKVWRISDFKCIETIQAHPEPVNAIVVADDGVLYTASDDATVKVWRRNFCSGSRPHSLAVTLPAKYSPVKTLALTLDGGVLYGGCTDGYIHYWLKGWFSSQLQYGGALPGHTHAVMSLASVGNYVVSGSADSTCRIWIKEQDGQHTCIAMLQGHRGPIRCVAAFPIQGSEESNEKGCMVCSGSLDGVLKVWRVRNTRQNRDSSQNAREYFELA
ncbi:COMPASS-like H3K4 histone methylase component WDR5A [Olea europaea subsp. europaea]|uniref:COMPASS-like H3K4 histone methylase component WDR5A n=1 Tax=Olea europaea subsp. europaea TaxID=158383 RepID=A0A8S0SII9_OLEEU|nr:COMPASS-like H3K4 histone methylase component WDR5A [Olea europaea subsp. europaea]